MQQHIEFYWFSGCDWLRGPATTDTDIRYIYMSKVENLFAKLKDWRRIATRYDRCAHTFFSAICIAAAVIFWL